MACIYLHGARLLRKSVWNSQFYGTFTAALLTYPEALRSDFEYDSLPTLAFGAVYSTASAKIDGGTRISVCASGEL